MTSRPTSVGGRPDRVSLRRNRDFSLLWVGQATSQLGSGMSNVAFPLLVLALTGSPALAGVLAGAVTATNLLLRVPAGLLVDRCRRRTVLLACDGARAATMAGLALAVVTGRAPFALILAAGMLDGGFGSAFAPAEAAAVRKVVPPPAYRSAAAVNQARGHLASLLGTPIGGVLYGAAQALPFLANAVSYLASTVCIAFIRAPLGRAQRSRERAGLVRELLAGFGWLWRQPFLRATLLWIAAVSLLYSSIGLLVVVLAQQRGSSAAEIGVMLALNGAGGLLGAVAAPWLLRWLRGRVVVIGFGWWGAATLPLLLGADSAYQIGAVGAVAFFPVPALIATIQATIATHAPDDLQGRVNSAAGQVAMLAAPLGPPVAGVLLGALGGTRTIACYAAGMLLLAVLATTSRGIRSGRD